MTRTLDKSGRMEFRPFCVRARDLPEIQNSNSTTRFANDEAVSAPSPGHGHGALSIPASNEAPSARYGDYLSGQHLAQLKKKQGCGLGVGNNVRRGCQLC